MNEVERTAGQNKKFHAMVRDIAAQLKWAGEKWGDEDWKRLFLAAKFEQRVVPSPFGHGFVVVNWRRSRELSIEQMTDLIGEMKAFAEENGVIWSDEEKHG